MQIVTLVNVWLGWKPLTRFKCVTGLLVTPRCLLFTALKNKYHRKLVTCGIKRVTVHYPPNKSSCAAHFPQHPAVGFSTEMLRHEYFCAWLDPSQLQLEAFQFGANEAPGTLSSLGLLWKSLFVAMPAQMEPLPWADITLVLRGNGNAEQKIIVAREKNLELVSLWWRAGRISA